MFDIKENILIENNEFDHLVKLLDDEDENIYSNIKERFLSYGEHSSNFLKNYLNDNNILIRNRANEILSIINFEKIEEKFKVLSLKNEEKILEEAMFILAAYGYPEVNISEYKRTLDRMASLIKAELLKTTGGISSVNPLEILNSINNCLFFEKGFKGNSENYYEPDNSYINKVIDTRLGIPITLSVIYILISRRLNLPIFGINLPGHFIIKYSDEKGEFFIDPFNKGVIISKKEAEEFVKKIGMSKDDFDKIPYLKSTSDKEIVLRVMRNLIEIYNKKNETLRAAQLEKLMLYLC